MAKLIELNLRPDDRTLRSFGFIALGGFGLLALCAYTEMAVFAFGLGAARLAVTMGLLAAGAVAAVCSLVWPRANLPMYVGISLLSFPIGYVLSHVILFVLFFLVIGPIGVLVRTFGRDPMQRAYDKDAATYFSPARPRRDRDAYFRQF